MRNDATVPMVGQVESPLRSPPGKGFGVLQWEPGKKTGTLKLVAYAGDSAAGTIVVDNVGDGNGR